METEKYSNTKTQMKTETETETEQQSQTDTETEMPKSIHVIPRLKVEIDPMA